MKYKIGDKIYGLTLDENCGMRIGYGEIISYDKYNTAYNVKSLDKFGITYHFDAPRTGRDENELVGRLISIEMQSVKEHIEYFTNNKYTLSMDYRVLYKENN